MRWTNDVYVSTPHRVVNLGGRHRYSVAFFMDPNPDAVIACLPTCVSAKRGRRSTRRSAARIIFANGSTPPIVSGGPRPAEPARRQRQTGSEMASPTKARQIQQAIADDIVHGRLAPGTALDETSIAAAFGVSRTPIREAIRQLEAIGLIEARARRGAVVADLADRQLDEMFAVMAELEALCARWSAIVMTAAERRQLLGLQEEGERLVSAGQPRGLCRFQQPLPRSHLSRRPQRLPRRPGAQRAHPLRPLPPGAVRDAGPAGEIARRARRGGDGDPARRCRRGGDRDARPHHRGAHGRGRGRRRGGAPTRRTGSAGRQCRREAGGFGRAALAVKWGSCAHRLISDQQILALAYNTASGPPPAGGRTGPPRAATRARHRRPGSRLTRQRD